MAAAERRTKRYMRTVCMALAAVCAAAALYMLQEDIAAYPQLNATHTAKGEPYRQQTALDLLTALDSLPQLEYVSESVYSRDYFGQKWFDADRNGCDTRNDILRRDLENARIKPQSHGCKVLSGELEDWYSGKTVHFESGEHTSQLVQIDHVVPLAWAWKHGADVWRDEQRREFANDPMNLRATTEAENQSKKASGPAKWMPSSPAAACRYSQLFIRVLAKYELAIGAEDKEALRENLEKCADGTAGGEFFPEEEE